MPSSSQRERLNLVAGDLLNGRPLVMTRALAGYLTAKSGRELIFSSVVNNTPISDLVTDTFAVIHEQGQLVERIFAHN